jgi:hypothetical protein
VAILSAEDHKQTLDLVEVHGTVDGAARAAGMSRTTLQHRYKQAKAWARLEQAVEMPEFPDDDLPVEELIELQTRRFEKRSAHQKSKRWFPVNVKIDGPIGLSFFGDPHTDDNGCNWTLLRRDCKIHEKTPGLFGLNVGDTTNNWVGRLMYLASKQDASQNTARKFAKWLLSDSGVTWLAWVLGNHDAWNEGDAILKEMGGHMIPMEDWQAQFTLKFPNGRDCRIWCAHDFPGNSQWNSLHGPQKAAHTKDWAHVYACGHKHNWAMHQEESASKEFVYWLIRARGYKFLDDYAEKLGHASQQEGATITAVIDPDKTGTAFVQCYADVEAAADYLTYLRKRLERRYGQR